ncbi:MAG: 16S rRNA (guanine(527)-N(7))-methyltransferase RsmG [Helicobacteraceae bacterium]|jgi:16S rRNA (guanine527-N7)-methyltransferase|nr:16S rRNA (guanine(527)-N(7))-methyltransferase RsmG [Helicobacteraceae bacterium]
MDELRDRLLANRLIMIEEFYQKCDQFSRILLNWNKAHNLSGAKTERDIEKHIFDSVYPLSFLDNFANCMDIGSGAGFPGLVLAMAKPRSYFTLVEPLNKRASFLQFAASILHIDNAEIVDKRVEQAPIKTYDLIASRAVSDAKTIWELAKPFMSYRSILLLYKGKKTAKEAIAIGAKTVVAPHATYLLIGRQTANV